MTDEHSADYDATDEQVMAARREAWRQGIQDPFMARVRDYADHRALREADAEAEQQNMGAWREVLRAATRAIPPAKPATERTEP